MVHYMGLSWGEKHFEEEPNETAKHFFKMVNTASEPIYPNNANFTILEFSMKLLEWKNKHNYSNNGFDDLLHLIGLVLVAPSKPGSEVWGPHTHLIYNLLITIIKIIICSDPTYQPPRIATS